MHQDQETIQKWETLIQNGLNDSPLCVLYRFRFIGEQILNNFEYMDILKEIPEKTLAPALTSLIVSTSENILVPDEPHNCKEPSFEKLKGSKTANPILFELQGRTIKGKKISVQQLKSQLNYKMAIKNE